MRKKMTTIALVSGLSLLVPLSASSDGAGIVEPADRVVAEPVDLTLGLPQPQVPALDGLWSEEPAEAVRERAGPTIGYADILSDPILSEVAALGDAWAR